MKYYDHLDVIPIFMTSLLIFNILSGLVILDEMDNYVPSDFLGIGTGIILCMSGISILITKNAEIERTEVLENDPKQTIR